MNYLTNYYKNLSEQLQNKVNNLQKLLIEQDTLDRSNNDVGDDAPGEATPLPGSNEDSPFRNMPSDTDSQELWQQWMREMWEWYTNRYPFPRREDYPNDNEWGQAIQTWKYRWSRIQELSPDSNPYDRHPAAPHQPNAPGWPVPERFPQYPTFRPSYDPNTDRDRAPGQYPRKR
jgi:hypothetical protein